jgi:hypothetical protein
MPKCDSPFLALFCCLMQTIIDKICGFCVRKAKKYSPKLIFDSWCNCNFISRKREFQDAKCKMEAGREIFLRHFARKFVFVLKVEFYGQNNQNNKKRLKLYKKDVIILAVIEIFDIFKEEL